MKPDSGRASWMRSKSARTPETRKKAKAVMMYLRPISLWTVVASHPTMPGGLDQVRSSARSSASSGVGGSGLAAAAAVDPDLPRRLGTLASGSFQARQVIDQRVQVGGLHHVHRHAD